MPLGLCFLQEQKTATLTEHLGGEGEPAGTSALLFAAVVAQRCSSASVTRFVPVSVKWLTLASPVAFCLPVHSFQRG